MENCARPEQDRTLFCPDAVAAAYTADGRLVVQGRTTLLTIFEADGLQASATIPFSSPRVPHTGHTLFHIAPATVACASCHPEGRDDGHVWSFAGLGERRTQTVLGGVLDTAPLHWDGDMDSLHTLMGEVFVNRMGGGLPSDEFIEALGGWLQSLDHLPASAPREETAAGRGAQLFQDPAVGCATCHSGDKLTDNETVDVGTGKAFQVPSLVGIADRAPFMHDGCAQTLRDRFDPACGGGDAHGKTSHLTAGEIDDLVAYLETL
jgi:cytochrome c peroxidase